MSLDLRVTSGIPEENAKYRFSASSMLSHIFDQSPTKLRLDVKDEYFNTNTVDNKARSTSVKWVSYVQDKEKSPEMGIDMATSSDVPKLVLNPVKSEHLKDYPELDIFTMDISTFNEEEDEDEKKEIEGEELYKAVQMAHPIEPIYNARMYNLIHKRHIAHERALDAFQNVKLAICEELQSEVKFSLAALKDHLVFSTDRIRSLFKTINDEKLLMEMETQNFNNIWEITEGEFRTRMRWFKQLNKDMLAVEGKRQKMMIEELDRLSTTLQDIGCQLPDTIQKTLEPIVKELNLDLIHNKGAIHELIAMMEIRDFKLRNEKRSNWEKKMDAWKHLRHKHTVKKWKNDFDSTWRVPQKRKILTELLQREQCKINLAVKIQLDKLYLQLPPNISDLVVTEITSEIDSQRMNAADLIDQFLGKWKKLQEIFNETARDQLKKLKAQLMHYAAFDEKELDNQLRQLDESFIGIYRRADCDLYFRVEKLLLAEDERFFNPCWKIATFFVKICKTWTEFLQKLETEEVEKSEALLEMRDKLEERLEILEEKLQVLVKDLKNASQEESLDKLFEEIRELLEGETVSILQEQKDFNLLSVKVVRTCEPDLRALIDSEEAKLCDILGFIPAKDLQTVLKDHNTVEEVQDQLYPVLTNGGKEYIPLRSSFGQVQLLIKPSKNRDEQDSNQADYASNKEVADDDGAEEFLKKQIDMVDPIPRDDDGNALMQLFYFDDSHCSKAVEKLRMYYVNAFETAVNYQLKKTLTIVKKRQEELDEEVDLAARKIAPRISQIESGHKHIRLNQLSENEKRFHRLSNRIMEKVRMTRKRIADGLRQGRHSLNKMILEVKTNSAKLKTIDNQGTLTNLWNMHSKAILDYSHKVERNIKECNADVAQYIVILSQAIIQFFQGDNLLKDGGSYALEEIKLYQKRLDETKEIGTKFAAELAAQVLEFETNYKGFDREIFQKAYQIRIQEVQILAGLGQRYGAPKRTRSSKLRNEMLEYNKTRSSIEEKAYLIDAFIKNCMTISITEVVLCIDFIRRHFCNCGEYLETLSSAIDPIKIEMLVPNDGLVQEESFPTIEDPIKRNTFENIGKETEIKFRKEYGEITKSYYLNCDKEFVTIPSNTSVLPPKLEQHIQIENMEWTTSLHKVRLEYRGLVKRHEERVSKLPRAVFENLLKTFTSERCKKFNSLMKKQKKYWLDIQERKKYVKSKMKPSLSLNMLTNLVSIEEKRKTDAWNCVESRKAEMVGFEEKHLALFNNRISYYTQIFLTLFDTTPVVADVKEEFEEACKVTVRKSLSEIVENFRIEEKAKCSDIPWTKGADATRDRFKAREFDKKFLKKVDDDTPPVVEKVIGFSNEPNRQLILYRNQALDKYEKEVYKPAIQSLVNEHKIGTYCEEIWTECFDEYCTAKRQKF